MVDCCVLGPTWRRTAAMGQLLVRCKGRGFRLVLVLGMAGHCRSASLAMPLAAPTCGRRVSPPRHVTSIVFPSCAFVLQVHRVIASKGRRWARGLLLVSPALSVALVRRCNPHRFDCRLGLVCAHAAKHTATEGTGAGARPASQVDGLYVDMQMSPPNTNHCFLRRLRNGVSEAGVRIEASPTAKSHSFRSSVPWRPWCHSYRAVQPVCRIS